MPSAIDFASAGINFLELVHSGEFSDIFLTSVDSLRCIMKVYHDNTYYDEYEAAGEKPPPLIFTLERDAYQRLTERGLCEEGIVPRYYGFLEKLDVKLNRWVRNLVGFSNDKNPPNALFIEYIPNLIKLNLETYNEQRMLAFIRGLEMIHAARVLHRDVRPRNMMIVSEPRERVIWMDFDRARTYSLDHLTTEEDLLFANEMKGLGQMGPELARDQIKGKIDESGIYFYT